MGLAMPTPFLSGAPDNVRSAYPLVQGAVRQDLSMAAIGRIVRAADIRISSDRLRDLIRRERILVERGHRVGELRPDQLPNPLRLPEALTAIRRAFSFNVEVRITRPDLTEEIRRVTVSTDSLMTREELEDAAADLVEKGETYGEVESVESNLVFGMRAGRFGTI